MEDKKQFVADLNAALIANGGGSYDYLKDHPLTYVPIINGATQGISTELVTQGPRTANITGDSLGAILGDLVVQGVL